MGQYRGGHFVADLPSKWAAPCCAVHWVPASAGMTPVGRAAPYRRARSDREFGQQAALHSRQSFRSWPPEIVPVRIASNQAVPGARGQEPEERVLGPAVALAKRMDRVEFGEKMRGLRSEVIAGSNPENTRTPQAAERACHLWSECARDSRTCCVPFVSTHRPVATSPAIHVLEQVAMDRPIVAGARGCPAAAARKIAARRSPVSNRSSAA